MYFIINRKYYTCTPTVLIMIITSLQCQTPQKSIIYSVMPNSATPISNSNKNFCDTNPTAPPEFSLSLRMQILRLQILVLITAEPAAVCFLTVRLLLVRNDAEGLILMLRLGG